MNKRAFSLLALLFVAASLLLAGCAAAPTPTPPTAIPLPTATRPPRPTMTPLPSPTPTPKPGPTPTLEMAMMSAPSDQPGLAYWSDPNDVLALLLDDAGYLWAATSAGVVRWEMDGSRRTYGLADGLASLAIRGLAQDGDGHLWVGYSDHPGWSELADGETWTTYATRQQAVEARYAAMLTAPRMDESMFISRDDSHWVWMPTVDGELESYDGERWRNYGAYKGVTSYTWLVDLTAEGRVWAVGRGVSTCEEGEVWWDDHNLFSEISSRIQVTDMALDHEGGLWLSFTGVGERGGGACRYDEDQALWAGYLAEFNDKIPGQVYDIDIDAQGTIWLCGDGALAYQQLGEPWRVIALPGVTVKTYTAGANGRLWLGTNQGIWHCAADGSDLRGPWRVPAPILGSNVVALAQDDADALWIATDQGVTQVSPDGLSVASLAARVYCLERSPDGHIWAGTTEGVFDVSVDAQESVIDTPAIALAFAADGTPWYCDEQGVVRPWHNAGPTEAIDLTALAGAMPRDMDMDAEGTLWFATGEGLGILASDGTFELQTRNDRLLSDDVRAVDVSPDGIVWVATDMGLVRRRLDGRWTRFTPQSTEGGLLDWEMWGLYADGVDGAAGELWMTTSGGISRREPENADWSNLALTEARCILPDADVQAGEDGAIWVGTRSGLYRLRVGDMKRIE